MLIVRYSKNNTINHNNRKSGSYEHNENINKNKIKENITITKFNSSKIEKDINAIYEKDIIKYNNQQKRKDRKIKNYFKEKNIIKNQHELLIDISNNQNYFINENENDKKFWKNSVKNFMKENSSSMYFTNVVIHLDEGRPHAHLNFIPKNNTKNRIQSWNSFQKMCTQINEENRNSKKSAFENTIQKMLNDVYSIMEKENLLSTSYSKVDLKYTDVGSKKEKQVHLKMEDYKEKILMPRLVEKQVLDEKVSKLNDTQQKLISSINSLEKQKTRHKEQLKNQEERMNQEIISQVEKNKIILEKKMNAELKLKRQEIEKSLNELKNEKQEWEDNIKELKREKEYLEEKTITDITKKVSKLNDTKENLEKSINSLEEEKNTLERQKNELKSEKEEWEEEITELSAEKINLEENIEKLEKRHESLLSKVKAGIKKIFNNFKIDTTEEDNILDMLDRDIDKLSDDENWYHSYDYKKEAMHRSLRFETNLEDEVMEKGKWYTKEEKIDLINSTIRDYNLLEKEKENKLNNLFEKFKNFISLENIESIEEELEKDIIEEKDFTIKKTKKGRTM